MKVNFLQKSISLPGYLVLLVLFFAGLPLRAQQQGQLDPSFNPTDVGFNTGIGANNAINALIRLSSGKIFIAGGFSTYNGMSMNRVAILNPDGSLDPAFAPGTGLNGLVNAAVQQPDGKFIVGGSFTTVAGVTRNRLARLNPDGTLDTSFDAGLPTGVFIQTLLLQPDGKILIGGRFTATGSPAVGYLARLNSDGTPDASFNTGTGYNKLVYTLVRQPNGKILVGGDFTTYNGVMQNRISRLNPDGTLDATFTPGTGPASSVRAILVQPDNKILIGGAFTKYNTVIRNRVARLNADGSLDLTFNPGTGADKTVFTLALQPNGSILLGGDFTLINGVSRNRIARINADGSLDGTFDPGTGFNLTVSAFALQPDGKLITAGKFTLYNGVVYNRITRLNPSGTADATFNPGSGANLAVQSISLQPDGKIIIGGSFTGYNGAPRNRVARLNTDGTPDLTFDPALGPDNTVFATAVQPDGKIIIGGSFKKVNGIVTNRIQRLTSAGLPDPGFTIGTGANNIVYAVKLLANGKILIGGNFTTYNDQPVNYIARLNADGTLDQAFNTGTGFNKAIHAFEVQPDGKILVGGDFTTYNGLTVNRLIRLNPDGTQDTGFQTGAGPSAGIRAIALQPNGKILIGGGFAKYNNVIRSRIARLNSDGTLDLAFTVGTGFNAFVRSIQVQNDGKVLITGDFITYNTVAQNRVARLNSDGTLDTAFNTGTGANAPVLASAIQPNGHILIGGNFTSYNGTGRNRMARIFGQPVTPPTIATAAISQNAFCAGTTVTVPFTTTGVYAPGNFFTALLSDASGSFANPVNIGAVTATSSGTISASIPFNTPAGSAYRIRVVGSNPATLGTANTVNLGVSAAPPLAVSVSSQLICQGTAINLSASGAQGYSWSTGQTNAAFTATPSTTTTYTVTGTSAQGCAIQATTTVTVVPPPALTVVANPISICSGQTATLVANGADTYTWQPGNGLSATSGDTVTVAPVAVGTYTYSVTGSNGVCPPVQASVQVQVLNTSVATVSYAAVTYCQNQPNPTPTASASGTYSASPAGLVFSNANTGVINLASSQPGTYTIQLTGTGFCAPTGTTTVTINQAPGVTVTPQAAACQGNTVTLQANGAAQSTYSWSGPNNFTATGQTITLPNTTPNMSGSYSVFASLPNGCTQAAASAVTVTAIPAAGFTYTQGSCAGCINFTNTSNNQYSYTWNFGDVAAFSNAPNPTHQYTSSGTYTVTQYVISAGCTATATQVISILLSAEDELNENARIYPNPTQGKLFVELPALYGTDILTAEIYTVSGQRVWVQELNAGTENELNLTALPAGAYLMRIATPQGVLNRQIMIQD